MNYFPINVKKICFGYNPKQKINRFSQNEQKNTILLKGLEKN